MSLKQMEQDIINGLFKNLAAEHQVDLAKAMIREAAEYLDKNDHIEMTKWFIDAVADFPGE